MSTVEEDVEARDLVAQTLEKNGCLAKLRAELRASIFLALDEDIKLSQQRPLQNLRVQSYLETPEGRAMFGLVREFLDFFNLQFTISVYEAESYLESIGLYEGRKQLAQDLGLDNTDDPTVPLLQQLLKIAQSKSKILDINLNVNGNVNSSYIDESLRVESSYKKTETNNSILNNNSRVNNEPSNISDPIGNESSQYFNSTFDLNSPTVNLSQLCKVSNENVPSKNILKEVIEEEDTFEDKSSVKEDSKIADISNQSSSSASITNNDSNKTPNLLAGKNGVSNATFELTSPSVNINNNKQISNENDQINDLSNKKLTRDDDTYEDTSSIAEDSEGLGHLNSLKAVGKLGNEVPYNNSKKSDQEKPKLSPQRTKTSLSSLTDLPPLQMNKSRVSSDILPSLYSKEFKNKSNLKELDKMFDMDADYEEDFMYSSNELSLNSNQSKSSPEEQPIINKMDSEKLNFLHKKESKSSNKAIPEMGKSMFRQSVQKNCSNLLKSGERNSNGSNSEHSLSD